MDCSLLLIGNKNRETNEMTLSMPFLNKILFETLWCNINWHKISVKLLCLHHLIIFLYNIFIFHVCKRIKITRYVSARCPVGK